VAPVGWEYLQRQVLARLESALPAELARISAAAGDGVPLPEPGVIRLHPLEVESEYPAVYILPGVATPRRQTAREADVDRGIVVVARHRASSAEELGLGLIRYEAAIVAVVRGQGHVDPNVIVHWSESRPAPFFETTGADQMWESAVQVSFVMKQVEELT